MPQLESSDIEPDSADKADELFNELMEKLCHIIKEGLSEILTVKGDHDPSYTSVMVGYIAKSEEESPVMEALKSVLYAYDEKEFTKLMQVFHKYFTYEAAAKDAEYSKEAKHVQALIFNWTLEYFLEIKGRYQEKGKKVPAALHHAIGTTYASYYEYIQQPACLLHALPNLLLAHSMGHHDAIKSLRELGVDPLETKSSKEVILPSLIKSSTTYAVTAGSYTFHVPAINQTRKDDTKKTHPNTIEFMFDNPLYKH